MQDAIRDDTLDQLGGFVARLRATLDPDKYPHPDDGATFDASLHALEQEFERIKRLFHDCLMAQWSNQIEREVQKQLDANRSESGRDEGAETH